MCTLSPHGGTISYNDWVASVTLVWRHLFCSGQTREPQKSLFLESLCICTSLCARVWEKKRKLNEIKKNSVWKNERMDSSVKQHSNDLVKLHDPSASAGLVNPNIATWTLAHRSSTNTFLTFPKMTIHKICEGTTGWRIWTSLTPGCRQVRAGLDAGRLCVCQPPQQHYFFSPLSSIEQC